MPSLHWAERDELMPPDPPSCSPLAHKPEPADFRLFICRNLLFCDYLIKYLG